MSTNEGNIQVMGCGLPRTGTASLKIALEILGFKKCHHMQDDVLPEAFPYSRGRRWINVWDTEDKAARQALIRSLLTGYKATVDFPPSMFVDDLIEMYPDAKVILGVRNDPKKWRESFNATLDLSRTSWFVLSTYLLPFQRLLIQPMCGRWEKQCNTRYDAKMYQTETDDVYLRHNDWVRSLVPKDRLLEFEPSQGWGPLCEFLGVSKPVGVDFPHVNDTKTLRAWFMTGAMVGWVSWALFAGFTLGMWQWITHWETSRRFLYREL